ncbi:hypothetical protein SCLCIDRAFT_1221867 [Scleroderma citrinum Foug A]|uniref:Uncharacterized protein n=1 Tax=Scleroderma citrinum Foug A TaxID=1036808 RepID=A0A0C3DER4_9AGAM|nr:hypothetical protein SCLCIDRAFT_1221867 [Scleroderma citrinum Foug A]
MPRTGQASGLQGCIVIGRLFGPIVWNLQSNKCRVELSDLRITPLVAGLSCV